MEHQYSQQALIEFGTLTVEDIKQVNRCRGCQNILGFAYQLIFVKLLNYFPAQEPFNIVDEILTSAGLQVSIDLDNIELYKKHREHIARHQDKIKAYLIIKKFGQTEEKRLKRFLLEVSSKIEQQGVLLTRAKQWLRENKILQPAKNTLLRLIVTQREQARKSIFTRIRKRLTKDTIETLDNLITVMPESNFSTLQQLKQPPKTPSADSHSAALLT